MYSTRLNAPESAPCVKLHFLFVSKVARILHDLASPGLAADLKAGLQHAIAHAAAQIQEHLIRLQPRFFENGVHESWENLSVDQACAVFVFSEQMCAWRNGPGIYLIDDGLYQGVVNRS